MKAQTPKNSSNSNRKEMRSMEIQTEKLRETLKLLERVVPRKPTMAILTNVLLKDGCVMATDLEIAVRVELPEAEGAVLLPYKDAVEFLHYAPGYETCVITPDEGKVSMAIGESAATLSAPDPAEFPPFPKAEGESQGVLDGDALVRILDALSPYAATDESRPVLATVHINTADTLEVVAADGFRLIWEKLPGKLAGPPMNIPTRVVRVLTHLWKNAAAPDLDDGITHLALAKRLIRFQWNTGRLMLRFGKVTMVVQLTEGTFPNYRQLIPTSTTTGFTVQSEDMMRALQQVKRVATSGSGIVRLRWGEDRLLISAKHEEEEVSVPVLAQFTEPGRTALAINYMLEYFGDRTGEVSIQQTGSEGAGVLFSHRGMPHVMIMPMQVKW